MQKEKAPNKALDPTVSSSLHTRPSDNNIRLHRFKKTFREVNQQIPSLGRDNNGSQPHST